MTRKHPPARNILPKSDRSSAWKPPELTATSERVYRRLYQHAEECNRSGDSSNSKVTLFRMVDEVITKIIPYDPVNPQRALSGPLANIYRIKKGRIRICYLASSKQRRIVVLCLSETLRKAGAASDPYNVLTCMVLSGEFAELFASLGVKPPRR